MEPDAFSSRERGDPIHLGLIERFPEATPYRCLNGDDGHRPRNAPAARSVDHLLDVVEGEGGPSWSQGHQGHGAQRLDAVTRVIEQVAFRLHNGAAAGPSRQPTHGQVIGQGPGRHEHRAFFPQQCRALLLQRFDDTAVRVGIGRNQVLVGQVGQQPPLIAGGQTQTVTGHLDTTGRGRERDHPAPLLCASDTRADSSGTQPHRACP